MSKIRKPFRMLAGVWAALLIPGLVLAQADKPEDVWKPFRYFVGKWEGAVSGKFGTGSIQREYRFVLDGAFLQVEHNAVYAPREKYPEGEVHKELGFFSRDRATGTYVLRQFHNETIINEYVLEEISPDGRTMVLVTRHIENYKPGWRAKETYKILGPDEFVEVFELAPPDKPFQVYVENRFQRKP